MPLPHSTTHRASCGCARSSLTACAPGAGWAATAGGAIGAGLVVGVVARPWIGVVCALAVLLGTTWSPGVVAVDLFAALMLLVSRARSAPDLAWLTIGLLISDLVTRLLTRRSRDELPDDAPTAPARR